MEMDVVMVCMADLDLIAEKFVVGFNIPLADNSTSTQLLLNFNSSLHRNDVQITPPLLNPRSKPP